MNIMLQYDASNNTMILRKNWEIVGGPVLCTTAPSDRSTSNESYVGKSRFTEDISFHGEMSGLVVADETVRNLARSCSSNVASEHDPSCPALQSFLCDPLHSSLVLDGLYDTCSQSWRETSPWLRVDLQAPRLVVCVRVFGRMDQPEELEGFEIRVGNWASWGNNPVCAFNGPVPGEQGWVDVMCQAEGRYLFIVLPGRNRSLALCEVEVYGMPNAATSTVISGLVPNCTSCQPGLTLALDLYLCPTHSTRFGL